jgi:uncharacterized damage-inducible protein DinB
VNGPVWAKTLAAYNRWMNERLLAHCAGLSDAERKRDRGAFFRSIHGTLNHLLLADRVWLGRFRDAPFAVRGLDQELYPDFAELRDERARTDADFIAWVSSLQPQDFTRELHYISIARPVPTRKPLWLAVAHAFNHQTHHRGQVTTLLKQSGVDPGVTDLIAMPPE